MYKRLIFKIVIFYFSLSLSYGQQTVHLTFQPSFHKQPVVLNTAKYVLNNSNTFTFSTFKFYVSNIAFIDTLQHQVIYTDTNSYLVDVDDVSSLQINVNIPSNTFYHRLQFLIGLDSLHQVANSKQGVYHPKHGMFWSWHSGYLNVKLDGTCSSCSTRNHEFSQHLGGYRSPYVSQKIVTLFSSSSAPHINIDIATYLQGIDFSNEANEMTPGLHSQQLSDSFINTFSIH